MELIQTAIQWIFLGAIVYVLYRTGQLAIYVALWAVVGGFAWLLMKLEHTVFGGILAGGAILFLVIWMFNGKGPNDASGPGAGHWGE